MNKDNFTPRALQALAIAEKQAEQLDSGYIGTEHLLIALCLQTDTVAQNILKKMGVSPELLSLDSLGRIQPLPIVGDLSYSAGLRRALVCAQKEVELLDHTFIGTEHLLLGLAAWGMGSAAQSLQTVGLSLEVAREEVRLEIAPTLVDPFQSAALTDRDVEAIAVDENIEVLLKHGEDYTDLAEQGRLDPVIGRKKEMDRIIHILCRRRKNNPVLLGEAGVGKTAIAEGLAQAIANKEVPKRLQDMKVFNMDLAGMVAGTKYRGEFEKKIKAVVEAAVNAGNVILFIDELHTIVGAGSAEGALDAANIIKPALARGTLRVIGATTIDEYKGSIENDAALGRRFQPVDVHEPSVEEATEILMGIKNKYEAYHLVEYTEDAIKACSELADYEIEDRQMPDKAIDLMDEAGATVSIAGGEKVERSHIEDVVRNMKSASKIKEDKKVGFGA